MKLINLTPHCLNLIIDEVGSQVVIPVAGIPARVSRIVADAAKAQGRTDCLVPDTVVRDDKGIILGCRSLAL